MTDNIEELRRKVEERQKERIPPEEQVDYILNHKSCRNLIIGLIQDKYGFSDINDLIYLITQDNNLNDKQKLGSISGLSCPFIE